MSERFPHQFLRHKRAHDLESTMLNPSIDGLFDASLSRAIQERTSRIRFLANSGKILPRPPIADTHDAIHTDAVSFPSAIRASDANNRSQDLPRSVPPPTLQLVGDNRP